MQSRKQPKVHKYSRKRRRSVTSPGRALLSIGFTFLVAGAVGVVGYSIAKPILQFAGGDSSQASTAETTLSAVDTTTSVTEFAAAVTTTTTAVTTEAAVQSVQGGVGVRLSASALESKAALTQALKQAREEMPEGKLLIIPLKIQGGAVLYETESGLAKQCGAAQGTLTLSEIVAAAEEQGWTPAAECSLLYDNLLPDADAQVGYLVTDGSRWLDNKKENGGKAWASPFSNVTVDYLKELTREIAGAGFAQIWCTDVIFPQFRQSDLNYIGESVQSADRKDALVQLVNQLADTAGTVPVLVEVDAAGAAAGTEEVFVPDALEVSGVVLDLGTDVQQGEGVLQKVTQAAPEMSLWIIAETAGVSGEMEQLVSDFSLSGCVLYAEND